MEFLTKLSFKKILSCTWRLFVIWRLFMKLQNLIALVICVLQFSLHATQIQRPDGQILLNDIDPSIVRLSNKLVGDCNFAVGAHGLPVIPHVVQLPGNLHPAAPDYQAIQDNQHPFIKLMQELQNLLPENPSLFDDLYGQHADKIILTVATIKFHQPEDLFNKNDIAKNPKKKFFSSKDMQRNINPQHVFPFLQAAYDYNFVQPIKSGLARLYALAMFATLRQIRPDEDVENFQKTNDIEFMDEEKIRDYLNLNENNAIPCSIKNEIKRQYLYLFGQWIDGKSFVLTHHHGGLHAALCQEVVKLIEVGLVPPFITVPLGAPKSVQELTDACYCYLNSWKNFFRKQIPSFLGIVNSWFKESWWVDVLPQELGKEVKLRMLIEKNKHLSSKRIENLTPDDLIKLAKAGKVPPVCPAVDLSLVKIAQQWVQDWAVPSAKIWCYDDEDIWTFLTPSNKPAVWLEKLPTELVKEVCKNYRCALIKKNKKWVETPHVCQDKNCQLPLHYLTNYNVIKLPEGTTQDGLSAMNPQEQARAFAKDFIHKLRNNLKKGKRDIAAITKHFSNDLKKEVFKQYLALTAGKMGLLEEIPAFKDAIDCAQRDDLSTTLAQALQSDEVKTIIANSIRDKGILDLSYMYLREITQADIQAIINLPGVNINTIRSFDVSHNVLENLPANIFHLLPALEVINLSHNRLQTLPLNLFGNQVGVACVPRLKELYCNHNQITQLPKGLFKGLENNAVLEIIDFSHNRLQEVDHMPLFGAIKVTTLMLNNNQLQALPASIFSHTQGPDGVIPVDVPDQAFKSRILSLNLANNSLTCEENTDTYTALSFLGGGSLEYLDLRHNRITKLLPIVRCGFSRLKHLLLDYNAMTQLIQLNNGPAIQPMNDLITLSASHNQIPEIRQNDCSPFPNLEYLILSHNQIRTIFEGAQVSELSTMQRLKLLYLDANELERISDKTFKNLSELKSLHLEGNKITTVPDYAFRDLAKLESLYLYANVRDFSFEERQGIANTVVQPHAFSGLDGLKHVDLSFNRIKTLPNNVFYNLNNLIYLNLSHNKLERLSYEMVQPLFNLETIDIAHNRLKGIGGFSSKKIKNVYCKGNNVVGIFKLGSHLNLFFLDYPRQLAKIPLFGYLTRLVFGKGVNVELERLNKLSPDLVRFCRALKHNRKFGIPGLFYLFRILGFKKSPQVIIRHLKELLAVKELEAQVSKLESDINRDRITHFIDQRELLLQRIIFGHYKDLKVEEVL